MRLGIFAKTFVRPTLEETLDAVWAHGFDCVQFNMACAGLPSLPERIDGGLADQIRQQTARRGITMAAVSGTFNMIHPDLVKRRDGLRRLRVLAGSCQRLGTEIITLSTGTRDANDMWRRHPENDSVDAWTDLAASLREALAIADDTGVVLAFEPEVANVVDSARKGRRLLDEMGSPRLKVVMDAANLFHAGELARMREILEEAFELLGRDIVLAHAKDLSHDGEAGHEAAGKGVLDYDYYLSLLDAAGFDGPLILHGLAETQVAESLSFLRRKLERVHPTAPADQKERQL
ncbi:MAG TPA: sugar phosphate isomerase/epimerase [Gemmataceae bacterium]|nr:sugar phosphate isomerase/epimerase [Gemmataceae bacterium]